MSNLPKGVFPCYKNQFAIGAVGEETPATTIADTETFSVSFDNGVEEWTAFENEGWTSRFMTAKSIKLSIEGKRNIGDAGNDEIAGLCMKSGHDVERNFIWNFPDGSSVLFKNAVISVSDNGTGGATNVAPLKFEVMSNGKPVYTPAA